MRLRATCRTGEHVDVEALTAGGYGLAAELIAQNAASMQTPIVMAGGHLFFFGVGV